MSTLFVQLMKTKKKSKFPNFRLKFLIQTLLKKKINKNKSILNDIKNNCKIFKEYLQTRNKKKGNVTQDPKVNTTQQRINFKANLIKHQKSHFNLKFSFKEF